MLCFTRSSSKAIAPNVWPKLDVCAFYSILQNKKPGWGNNYISENILISCRKCQALHGEIHFHSQLHCDGSSDLPLWMGSLGWNQSPSMDLLWWFGYLWLAGNRKMPTALLTWFVLLFHYFPSLLWPIINRPTFYLVFLFPLIYLQKASYSP